MSDAPKISAPAMRVLRYLARRSAYGGVAETAKEIAFGCGERLYRAEIEAGRLVAPTALDRYAATAAGHPDNPSTQAAKRMLAKLSKRSANAKVSDV